MKCFRGVGEQRKPKNGIFGSLPELKWGESQNKEEGGVEGN